ncbi:arylamine N-acetyltransferase [Terrabacter sp. NPDC080008]|uniref:arylamine N-acetyltransferase family protein n=1 Tax=Terrabacter sp. NPDC080008 TaxID=3155176 RepID=UPI00344C5CF7
MFESPGQLGPAVRAAYLARLGVGPEPPSADALQALVQRHAERVPYETLWIPAGERWSTDPGEAAERIALGGRGGYCYHLNGALGLLLRSLGYAVHGHVGGVQAGDPEPDSGAGPDPRARGNHLVLTVTGLPTGENPSGCWYVDQGLGDALYEPLPLAPGAYYQAPFHLTLEKADTGDRDDGDVAWTLTHDPAGGFRSMTWTSGEAVLSDFTAQHQWLSTSPESGFVRVPMAERRDVDGADVIRGLVLSRVGAGAFTHQPITRKTEWFDVLADVFDLRFDAVPPGYREQLWDAVNAAHRAWSAAHS